MLIAKADLAPAENHRAEGTGASEWLTPARCIAAGRVVMGDIDLDPATHPIAQQAIKAARYRPSSNSPILMSHPAA
jgi:hypothetical protein